MRSASAGFAIDNVPFIVRSHGPFLSMVNCRALLKPPSAPRLLLAMPQQGHSKAAASQILVGLLSCWQRDSRSVFGEVSVSQRQPEFSNWDA